MKMIAITSCPTGIAHTYMAAEALEEAAKAAGHEMVVETQGSAGSDDFPAGAVEAADVIIIAADVDVKGRERFTNMPQVNIGVKKAIDDAAGVIADAERAARDYVPGTAAAGGGGAPTTPAGADHRRRRGLRRGSGCPRLADDRRELHDPVRRGRRSDDRARLSRRRLPGHRPVRL